MYSYIRICILCLIIISVIINNIQSDVLYNFAWNDNPIQELKIGEIKDIKYFKDNRTIIICTSNGLFLWDTDSYKIEKSIIFEKGVSYSKLSPDGNKLFIAEGIDKNKYEIFDLRKEEITSIIPYSIQWYNNDVCTYRMYMSISYDYAKSSTVDSSYLAHPNTVNFTPDSKYIIFISTNNDIVVFDLDQRTELKRKHFDEEMPISLGFLSDNKTLWAGTSESSVYYMEYASLEIIKKIKLSVSFLDIYAQDKIKMNPIVVSPSGKYVISTYQDFYDSVIGSEGYHYILHDGITGDYLININNTGYVFGSGCPMEPYQPSRFQFSYDETALYSINQYWYNYYTKKMNLLEKTSIEYFSFPNGDINYDNCWQYILQNKHISVEPYKLDNKVLYYRDSDIFLVDIEKPINQEIVFSNKQYYNNISIDWPEGNKIILLNKDGKIIIIDYSDKSTSYIVNSNIYNEAVFSYDGSIILTTNYSSIQLYSYPSMYLIKTIDNIYDGNPIDTINISKNSPKIAIGTNNLYIIDVQTLKTQKINNLHSNGIWSTDFSNKNDKILSGGGDGLVKETIIDSSASVPIASCSDPVSFVKYLDEEKKVLAVNQVGKVYVFDRITGETLYQTVVRFPVFSKDDVAITKDEKYLIVENQVLNLQTKEWVNVFGSYENGNTHIAQVRISFSEEWVAVRTEEGEVRVWDADRVFNKTNINNYKQY